VTIVCEKCRMVFSERVPFDKHAKKCERVIPTITGPTVWDSGVRPTETPPPAKMQP